jgi:hypothetical protein
MAHACQPRRQSYASLATGRSGAQPGGTDLCCRGAQSGHALVGALMPEYDPVTKISIVPRGQAGGLTFFAPSEERLESGLYRRAPVNPNPNRGGRACLLRRPRSAWSPACTGARL